MNNINMKYNVIKNLHKRTVDDTMNSKGGFVISSDSDTIYSDVSERHCLVVAKTGGGKTTRLCIPSVIENILAPNSSFLVTDPRGDIYENPAVLSALKNSNKKCYILNFRNLENSMSFNPFEYIRTLLKTDKRVKAYDILHDMCSKITEKNHHSSDPYWNTSATQAIYAAALIMLEDVSNTKKVNMKTFINLCEAMFSSGLPQNSTSSGINIQLLKYQHLKGNDSMASHNLNTITTLKSSSKTSDCISSFVQSSIGDFVMNEDLLNLLSSNDMNIEDIIKEPSCIFLILPEENTCYHSIASLFIEQLFLGLCLKAEQNGGKLPYQYHFIIDEAANLNIKYINKVTIARSRNIRFMIILQNLEQLETATNRDHITLCDNCGIKLNMIIPSPTRIELSKQNGTTHLDSTCDNKIVPIVREEDIILTDREVLANIDDSYCAILKLTPWYEINYSLLLNSSHVVNYPHSIINHTVLSTTFSDILLRLHRNAHNRDD